MERKRFRIGAEERQKVRDGDRDGERGKTREQESVLKRVAPDVLVTQSGSYVCVCLYTRECLPITEPNPRDMPFLALPVSLTCAAISSHGGNALAFQEEFKRHDKA